MHNHVCKEKMLGMLLFKALISYAEEYRSILKLGR